MSTHEQVIIDSSEVSWHDRRFIILNVPVVAVYSIIVAIVCTTEIPLLAAILFAAIQLLTGLFYTRYSNQLGENARTALYLQDPALLGEGWEDEIQETHNSDIQRIFEGFHYQAMKADDAEIDDIMDLVWFSIIIWTVFSTAFVLFNGYCEITSLSSGIVLGVLSSLSYYYGKNYFPSYRYFEDDLSHLEYFVTSRMALFANMTMDLLQSVVWKVRNGKRAIHDFFVATEVDGVSIRYYIGISSKDNERLVIEADTRIIESIKNRLFQREISDWVIANHNERTMELTYIHRNVNLRNTSTFIETPDRLEYLRDVIEEILSVIPGS